MILFKKIPNFIYASIIIIGIISTVPFLLDFFTEQKIIPKLNSSEKINLYYTLITLLGLFFVAYQIQCQLKNNLINTEYLNQPDFEFIGFGATSIKGQNPKCCCTQGQKCTNDCDNEHWFNIKKNGKFPARDIEVSIFHSKEEFGLQRLERINKFNSMTNFDEVQYKLKPHQIDKKLLDDTRNDYFNILINYTSVYTKIKHRRHYKLHYSPNATQNKSVSHWGDEIKYFNVSLFELKDNKSITSFEIIKCKFRKLVSKIFKKKKFKIENWVADF